MAADDFNIFPHCDFRWGGYIPTVKNVLINLFGWRPNINYFAWYVFFHIFLMLVFPVYIRICKENFLINAAASVLIAWVIEAGLHTLPGYSSNRLITNLFDCFLYFPTAAMGYLIARHGIFEKVQRMIPQLSDRLIALLSGTGLVLIALSGRYFRGSIFGLNLDVIYVPCFVFGMLLLLTLLKNAVQEKGMCILSVFGKYSTEVWFLHAIFFSKDVNAGFEKILWWPKQPLLVFIWCFILCLPFAAFLHWLASVIDRNTQKIFFGEKIKIK